MPTEEKKTNEKSNNETLLSKKPRATRNEKPESWMWMQRLNVVNFTHNHSRFVHNFHFPAIKSLQTTNYTLLTYKPSTELQTTNYILQTLHEHFMTTFFNYKKTAFWLYSTQPSQRRPIFPQDFRWNHNRIATLVMFCLQFQNLLFCLLFVLIMGKIYYKRNSALFTRTVSINSFITCSHSPFRIAFDIH